nr:family 43 glycosylhydrolase [Tessaracoccus coleopterorum]
MLVLPLSPQARADDPVTFSSPGNPILADGSYYSADAAPLVANGRLYIYAGHDEASPQQGGFNMKDYGVFATDDVEAGDWELYKANLSPGAVFGWATGNGAYAGHTVEGDDGKFYWYAPVETKSTQFANRMAIGVAVSDTPTGPWTDALGEPLLDWGDVFGTSTNGQEVIDPHVFKDDDGQWYLYWGSWYVARAVKLEASMTAVTGPISTMTGLDSFFEAPGCSRRARPTTWPTTGRRAEATAPRRTTRRASATRPQAARSGRGPTRASSWAARRRLPCTRRSSSSAAPGTSRTTPRTP